MAGDYSAGLWTLTKRLKRPCRLEVDMSENAVAGLAFEPFVRRCDCHRCANARQADAIARGDMDALVDDRRMRLCPICGNKRCPKASDHDLACTGSNEPGQPGSSYGAAAIRGRG